MIMSRPKIRHTLWDSLTYRTDGDTVLSDLHPYYNRYLQVFPGKKVANSPFLGENSHNAIRFSDQSAIGQGVCFG